MPDALRTLAKELVTCSREFEPFVPGNQRNVHETLALLGGLEGLARQTLKDIDDERIAKQQAALQAAQAEALSQIEAEADAQAAQLQAKIDLHTQEILKQSQAAQALRASQQKLAQTQTPSSSRQMQNAGQSHPQNSGFGSSHTQYRPALRDPSVIDALLALRASRVNRSEPTAKVYPPGYSSQNSQNQANQRVSSAASQAAAVSRGQSPANARTPITAETHGPNSARRAPSFTGTQAAQHDASPEYTAMPRRSASGTQIFRPNK